MAVLLRAYGERWTLLRKWNFNPATDIARDYQGLWRWTETSPDCAMMWLDTLLNGRKTGRCSSEKHRWFKSEKIE